MERDRSLTNPFHDDRPRPTGQLCQHCPVPTTCHAVHFEKGPNHRHPPDAVSALSPGPRSVRAADPEPGRLESELHHPSAVSTVVRLLHRQFSTERTTRPVVDGSSKHLCKLHLLATLDLQTRRGLFWNPRAPRYRLVHDRFGVLSVACRHRQPSVPQITQPLLFTDSSGRRFWSHREIFIWRSDKHGFGPGPLTEPA